MTADSQRKATSAPQAGAPLVTAPAGPLRLLYRDDVLVVIDKPSGLVVHRGLSNERDNVLSRLRSQLGMPVYPVHRLDRATSGVLALVLAPEWVAPLQADFGSDELEKRYLALCRGVIREPSEVDHPVPRAESSKERVPAHTAIRPLEVFRDRYSLVEARPSTGRFHQIRRHLSHLHCPILGDTNYGDRKENRFFREHFGLMRLALHAASLTLRHPQTRERLVLDAELPADLRGPMAKLAESHDSFAPDARAVR